MLGLVNRSLLIPYLSLILLPFYLFIYIYFFFWGRGGGGCVVGMYVCVHMTLFLYAAC